VSESKVVEEKNESEKTHGQCETFHWHRGRRASICLKPPPLPRYSLHVIPYRSLLWKERNKDVRKCT
jgi:hypothetical protein